MITLKNTRENTNNEGISTIPVNVKICFIRTEIKDIMSRYMDGYRIYKEKFNSIHEENLKNSWSMIIDYPAPPEKPNIYESFTSQVFDRLIHTALDKRSDWSQLLEHQELHVALSNKS